MITFFIVLGIVVTVLFLILHFAARCTHDWRPYMRHNKRILVCRKCGRVKMME